MHLAQALLAYCATFVRANQGTVTSDHPLLGWFAGHTPRHLLDVMPLVHQQLRCLWQPQTIRVSLRDVWVETDRLLARAQAAESRGAARPGNSLLRFFRGRSEPSAFVNPEAAMRVQRACAFFNVLCNCLQSSKLEVIGSLAFLPELVPRLWTMMDHIGPTGGMAVFVQALPEIEKEPLIAILTLTTMLTIHMLMVIEDDEVFVNGEPFGTEQLLRISRFLHEFLFQALWHGQNPSGSGDTGASAEDRARLRQRHALRAATAKLLRHISELDSRKSFIPEGHWAIKGVTSSAIVKRLRTERQTASAAYGPAHAVLVDLPHILGFHDRVKLFHEEVYEDKTRLLAQLGEVRPRPRATIRRAAVLADGFRDVMALPAEALKDAIRIHFVNEHGMIEAGIDEEGLFKVRKGMKERIL